MRSNFADMTVEPRNCLCEILQILRILSGFIHDWFIWICKLMIYFSTVWRYNNTVLIFDISSILSRMFVNNNEWWFSLNFQLMVLWMCNAVHRMLVYKKLASKPGLASRYKVHVVCIVLRGGSSYRRLLPFANRNFPPQWFTKTLTRSSKSLLNFCSRKDSMM